MNIKKILLPSLVAGAVLASIRVLTARSAPAKRASKRPSYASVDSYIEEQIRELNIPGISLAIVEGDKIAYMHGFGHARPGGEAPAPQTPFFIGSLTKSFTAMAVMQLVEAGKVDLDAPVQHYLPWFRVADPLASAQITVRHLLNQTSGLSNSVGELILVNFDQSPGAAERQARELSTVELVHPVGSTFEYCNSNYQLLGLIIEAASGETYAAYIQKHIFTPLGMHHSYTSKEMALQDGLAIGHQYWFMQPIAAPNVPIPRGAMAGGYLISTAEDLAHFLIAHLNGGSYKDARILSEGGIHELHHGPDEIKFQGVSFKYGMGWFDSDLGPLKLIWHSGTLPDFYAFMGFMPDQKKGVVLLSNACHHHMNAVQSGVGMNVCALLAGGQPGPSPFDSLPWELRNQALIPAIQVIDIAATCYLLHRWRVDPHHQPGAIRKWGLHILLPLIHNLLIARTLTSMLGMRRNYLKWYMPDYYRIAYICGSFAALWAFLRTRLILRALRKPRC